MDKIELSKEEVVAILRALEELPYKNVASLISFFQTKLQQPQKAQ